jgi:hypothetical protein
MILIFIKVKSLLDLTNTSLKNLIRAFKLTFSLSLLNLDSFRHYES